MQFQDPRERLLVALDVADLPAALTLVDALHDLVGGFKVGLELCTSAGVPQVVSAVAAAGGRLFLDLKLKDIPNTVAGAVRAISEQFGDQVRMLTLYCDGGAAMLRAAVAATRAARNPPLLLGVTLLTSIDAPALHDELGISATPASYAARMAHMAMQAGLGGIVSSPHELAAVRQTCGPQLLTVVPGVRPTWAAAGDQRRVMTPAAAVQAGADYLVIGRPITAPPATVGGPRAAAAQIIAELRGSNP